MRRRFVINRPRAVFSRDSISDLKVWLRGDAGVTLVGGNVDVWADQSGSGQNVSAPAAVNRPAYSNRLNGLPVLSFNGLNSVLVGVINNPLTFTGGISIFATIRKSATPFNTFETIFSAGATGNGSNNNSKTIAIQLSNHATVVPKPALATDIWAPSGIQGNSVLTSSSAYQLGFITSNYSAHRTLGNSQLRLNRVAQSAAIYGTSNPLNLNTNAIQIGAYDFVALASSYFSGDIAEILVFSKQLSPAEIAIVEAYLLNKWGV